MKTLLISSLLILNISFINAQSTIYGLQLDTVSNINYFVSIDPDDATITQLDSISGVDVVANGTSTVNESSEFYIFTANDNQTNPVTRIYTIDINNGATLANPTLSASVVELNYDNIADEYYALEFEDTTTYSGLYYVNDFGDTIYPGSNPLSPVSYEYHLVSINTSTGIATRINTISGVNGHYLDNSSFNPTSKEYVFIAGDDVIYTIDANTGSIVSNPSLSTTIRELQLNVKTGIFYAISYNSITNTNDLVTVNTTTGVVTLIDSIQGLSSYMSGTSTLDTLNNRYCIVDDNDNLIHIDLSTANVTSNPQLSSVINNLCINVVNGGERIINVIKDEAQAGDLNAESNIVESGNGSYSNNEDLRSYVGEPFQAYPNPTKNQLTISITEAPTVLRVFNLNGILIETRTLNNKLNKIDVSNFQNGLYFFTLSDSTKTETKKINIQ